MYTQYGRLSRTLQYTVFKSYRSWGHTYWIHVYLLFSLSVKFARTLCSWNLRSDSPLICLIHSG